MAIFKQNNNSCYFVHIPRTGGRYVSSLFENSKEVECKYHKIHTQRVSGIDVTHLHYPWYEMHFNVQNIPHITVVRNPYDKFHSTVKNMHHMHNLTYDDLIDEESFSKFIQKQITDQSFHNNWFLQQSMFISPKTHVWKYEWGFGKEFRDWVFEKTSINISVETTTYDMFNEETSEQYDFDERVKPNIKKFYERDFIELNYN